jgi:hypothetical protein
MLGFFEAEELISFFPLTSNPNLLSDIIVISLLYHKDGFLLYIASFSKNYLKYKIIVNFCNNIFKNIKVFIKYAVIHIKEK